MSWDVVLFNSSEKITSPENLDETKLVAVSFSSVFEKYFKNIIIDEDHREIREDDFSICFFLDDEPTSNTLLNLYGESAIYPIVDLSIKNNWQIFDTGIGAMIDLDNPAKNGYHNFQKYLNQILKNKD